jgi:hypothetical protein
MPTLMASAIEFRRLIFLEALRNHCLDFWLDLDRAAKSEYLDDIEKELSRKDVVDEWLRKALVQALCSGLSPEVFTFGLTMRAFQQCPAFFPVLRDPSPYEVFTPDHDFGDVPTVESLEAFESRITADFKRQLRSYCKKLRQRYSVAPRTTFLQHAKWTAMVFSGRPVSSIAGDAVADALNKAVRRFARSIDLHLPIRKRGQRASNNLPASAFQGRGAPADTREGYRVFVNLEDDSPRVAKTYLRLAQRVVESSSD